MGEEWGFVLILISKAVVQGLFNVENKEMNCDGRNWEYISLIPNFSWPTVCLASRIKGD